MKKVILLLFLFSATKSTNLLAQHHPSYVHAIDLLVTVNWSLDRIKCTTPEQSKEQKEIHDKVSSAMKEIKSAASDDGKSFGNNEFPGDGGMGPDGTGPDYPKDILPLLEKALDEIDAKESNEIAKKMRNKAKPKLEDAISTFKHFLTILPNNPIN